MAGWLGSLRSTMHPYGFSSLPSPETCSAELFSFPSQLWTSARGDLRGAGTAGPELRAGPSPVIPPHALHGADDHIGGRSEGLKVDAHDVVIAHRPRQAHEEPPDGKPPPIDQKRAVHRLLQLDVKLFHVECADRVGDEADVVDRAPRDKAEAVHEKPVLIGAKPWPALGERQEIISRAPCQDGRDGKKLVSPGEPCGEACHRKRRERIKSRCLLFVVRKNKSFLQIFR